jgi:hypothetical protein
VAAKVAALRREDPDAMPWRLVDLIAQAFASCPEAGNVFAEAVGADPWAPLPWDGSAGGR